MWPNLSYALPPIWIFQSYEATRAQRTPFLLFWSSGGDYFLIWLLSLTQKNCPAPIRLIADFYSRDYDRPVSFFTSIPALKDPTQESWTIAKIMGLHLRTGRGRLYFPSSIEKKIAAGRIGVALIVIISVLTLHRGLKKLLTIHSQSFNLEAKPLVLPTRPSGKYRRNFIGNCLPGSSFQESRGMRARDSVGLPISAAHIFMWAGQTVEKRSRSQGNYVRRKEKRSELFYIEARSGGLCRFP